MTKKVISMFTILAIVLSWIPLVFSASVATDEANTASYTGSVGSTDLLFEFNNTAEDQARYKGEAYGGLNYDQETNGYWATAYNGSYTAYSIVNSGGTLRVHVTDATDKGGTYGPWVKITNTHGKSPSYNANSYDLYPLHFDPSGVKTVTIRFKLVNCTVPEGKIPEIVFEYYYTLNETYGYGNDMKAVYTFRDGEYMTISIPVSAKLTKADFLKGFGFRFRNIKGGSNALIYIDYMYIGANSAFVMKNHQDKTFLSQNTIPVASGVSRSQIVLKDTTNATQITGYVATISPSAKVTFKASYASYYTKGSTAESRSIDCMTMPFSRKVATDHADAYETATGDTVLLCTNANFFNTDTLHPRGYLVLEGNIVQTYDSFPAPYFAVLKDGSFAIRPFGTPLGDVQEAVSGYQWLVQDGELITTNDDETAAPRTAIGLKADGTVVWVAIDGRQEPYSGGLTIHELAELMYAAGCVNAINMDGGGSTTMAARYNKTGDLVLQNRPSDEGGARLLPTCLLLVAEPCNHKLTNQPYTLYPDGTHSQICASCGEEIRVSHTYENELCVCGDKEHFEGGLLFDFDNTDADKYRYTDPVYQYRNFDMTSNGTWGRGYWATGYTATTSDFTIDNGAGTLTVNVGQGYSGSEGSEVYGPWLKLTAAYGKAPTKTDNRFSALSYDPSNADYVELRFKVENCLVPSGTTPEIYFEYYYEKDGVYQGTTDMKATYTYTAGQYHTVTIPVSQTLRDADELQAFGLRFRNIKGSSQGKLTIDYIRIAEKTTHEPMEDASLRIYHSLNLASDISINYAVPKTDLESCENISLEIEIPVYEGNLLTGTRQVTLSPVAKGQYYYFTLDELSAVQMNNKLKAVLHWSKDGQDYYSSTDVYSIAQYAYDQLANQGIEATLKTLCADLLVYGAKAQIYKGYRTDALADASMTDTERAYCSDLSAVTFSNHNSQLADCANPSVAWLGKALNLGSKVTLRFVVKPASYTGSIDDLSLKVSYIDGNGKEKTETITEKVPYSPLDGAYAFDFDGLLAAELRSVLTVAVYAGEVQVSNSLIYSADTYGKQTSGTLGDVCKALLAYSDSAKTFFYP